MLPPSLSLFLSRSSSLFLPPWKNTQTAIKLTKQMPFSRQRVFTALTWRMKQYKTRERERKKTHTHKYNILFPLKLRAHPNNFSMLFHARPNYDNMIYFFPPLLPFTWLLTTDWMTISLNGERFLIEDFASTQPPNEIKVVELRTLNSIYKLWK